MQQVYGITGGKFHGKDTFAKLIVAEATSNPRMRYSRTSSTGAPTDLPRVTHFAGPLKRMCSTIWGLTESQMHDPLVKEQLFPVPIHMDLAIEAMRRETGLTNMKLAGKVAHSPREIMQFYGTEYVRATQDDYWIEQLKKDVRTGGDVIVPDTRFLNEATAIHELGGKIIKIVRTDLAGGKDGHASETEQNQITPDVVIYTRTGDLSNAKAIAKAVAAGFFEAVDGK